MLRHALIAILGVTVAVSAAPPNIRSLAADDVVILRTDGTSQIMKAAEFDALEAATVAPAPIESYNQTSVPGISRRGCEESTEVQVLSDEEFVDWDVAISPVVASKGNSVGVSVTQGYKLANRLTVKHEIKFGGKKIISVSLNKNLDMTWTTTQKTSLSFSVPDGQYGVVVSQPYVRRVQGNLLSGCTDSPTVDPFTVDTYESQAYDDLAWVKGIIRLCSSDTYPIPYCIGEGHHE